MIINYKQTDTRTVAVALTPSVAVYESSDVNKDWTCKDKDKDQAYKDQDKDFTYSYLLQVAALPTIAIKHKVKVHNIWL